MIRLSIRASRADAEAVNAALLEVAPTGIEQVDADDHVEFALYGAPGELPSLPRGEAEIGGARVRVSGEEVPDDWFERWKRFHAPVLVGGAVYVRPPWEEPAVRPGVKEVVIDPGRAFGTGAHPTTRLCVELLARTPAGRSLLDVGCGSGVLAIAGARLGFAPVAAVDVDPVAVAVTRANAEANDVVLDVRLVDAELDTLPAADVAVANVLLRPVEAILARLAADVAITSGYLAGERPAHPGWAHLETVTLDGWAADRFGRR